MSFGFAALIGVVFGYLPARKAAALMPTERFDTNELVLCTNRTEWSHYARTPG